MKDYDQMLYDILKPLALEDPPVRIYRNSVDVDLNSQSADYVVYSTGLNNYPRLYGDGKTLVRRCSCNVTVIEAGDGNNDNAGYLVNKVEKLLSDRLISYTRIDVGYVESADSMQTSFEFYIM